MIHLGATRFQTTFFEGSAFGTCSEILGSLIEKVKELFSLLIQTLFCCFFQREPELSAQIAAEAPSSRFEPAQFLVPPQAPAAAVELANALAPPQAPNSDQGSAPAPSNSSASSFGSLSNLITRLNRETRERIISAHEDREKLRRMGDDLFGKLYKGADIDKSVDIKRNKSCAGRLIEAIRLGAQYPAGNNISIKSLAERVAKDNLGCSNHTARVAILVANEKAARIDHKARMSRLFYRLAEEFRLERTFPKSEQTLANFPICPPVQGTKRVDHLEKAMWATLQGIHWIVECNDFLYCTKDEIDLWVQSAKKPLVDFEEIQCSGYALLRQFAQVKEDFCALGKDLQTERCFGLAFRRYRNLKFLYMISSKNGEPLSFQVFCGKERMPPPLDSNHRFLMIKFVLTTTVSEFGEWVC